MSAPASKEIMKKDYWFGTIYFFSDFCISPLAVSKNRRIFAPAKPKGTIAQLVEQRTENPCVPGSIPGGTTK